MTMSTSSAATPLGTESDGVVFGDRNSNVGANPNMNGNNAWLSGLLNSAKNRDTLLRLESGLVTFMLDVTKSRLQLPPCSSFQRRICVEVAERFGLEHTLDRPSNATNSSADPNAVLLVLVKTAKSSVPAVMLSQQITSDKPKLVKRPKARGSSVAESTHGSGSAGGRPNSIKNVSQEEYEQARARIFKDARNRTEQGNNNNSAGSDFASGNSSSSDALDSLLNVRVVGGGIARGPEEGKSFARRRARMMNESAGDPTTTSNAANGTGVGIGTSGVASTAIVNPTTSSVAGGIFGETGANVNVNTGNGSLCNNNSNNNAMDMGESSTSGGNGVSIGNGVTMTGNSNSMGDKDDPDFDRCYDKWAVRGNLGPPQMMYPPQYQHQHSHRQHAYHNHAMPAMTTMSTMTHAQAHAQAAAAAVSAYPIVPMYHVPRPPPPPPPSRPMHFFNPYDSTSTAHGNNGGRQPMAGPDMGMSIGGFHGSVNGHSMGPKGNGHGSGNAIRTPTYGLDSAADFPPLGSQNTSSGNGNNEKNRTSHLEHQQRR